MEWEFGVRGKLLTNRMDNNKVLLYSTKNYIQYPVINHNGKIYIYIYLPYVNVSSSVLSNSLQPRGL